MSTHKYFDRICAAAVAVCLAITVVFLNGDALGLHEANRAAGYESRLLDPAAVHTIDIAMDDWDAFIADCEDEEYSVCSVVIDGEAWRNVAIRAKGNTSLSNVSSMNSTRYSFKIEFDHYDKSETYYGLDKLCLNNLIQDNTLMKDFLTYRLMEEFGVDAPLCSYAFLTVNGEDWGLYLAVEGIEDAFLQRNYGADTGDLYKPDSMNMGGGRGFGRDFRMSEFFSDDEEDINSAASTDSGGRGQRGGFGGRGGRGGFGGQGGFPGMDGVTTEDGFPEWGAFPGMDGATTEDGFPDFSAIFGGDGSTTENGFPAMGNFPGMGGGPGGGGDRGGPGGGGGMGSNDVKLRYSDDDPDSYANIFDSAKTPVTDADKVRLIAALKNLSRLSGAIDDDVTVRAEDVLDVEEVLRYFVVHNYVVNGDSYTGSMIHNYYLRENGGRFSMIPWDYNLAFGTFQGNNASSAVNDPIDTPLSIGSGDSRPMADWIFADDAYTEQYHELLREFLDAFDLPAMIAETAELIAPYVERDPSKFCTYEEFETGVEALETFCALRAESVTGQLDGTIPTTDDGQSADPDSLIDIGDLNLSDTGGMNMGGGGPGGGRGGDRGGSGNMGTPPDMGSGLGMPPDMNGGPPDFSNGFPDGNAPDFVGSPPDGGATDFGGTPPDGNAPDNSTE